MGNSQTGGVEIGGSTMGYQVLRVYPDSPGSRAGLRAYFDFIIAIGNTRFNRENGSLREILKASVGQKLLMIVYNTRTKSVRNVEIVPSTSWGGNGLLGVSIKHSSFDRADERVWHVVQVEPGSPAQQAGFKANADYVIGSDSILQENDDLYNLIEQHEGKALKLFVYNIETDNCREVICYPNSKWGGGGYLGCEFGHGLLHRVPVGDVINEQGARSVVPNQSQQDQAQPTTMPPTTMPPTTMPPVSSNPYSFQDLFTQLHNNNSNTNATLPNNNASNNNMTNNFQPPQQPQQQQQHHQQPQQHHHQQQHHQQQQQQQQPQPPMSTQPGEQHLEGSSPASSVILEVGPAVGHPGGYVRL